MTTETDTAEWTLGELLELFDVAAPDISGALSAMLDLGKGAGPMQHNFDLRGEFAKENTK